MANARQIKNYSVPVLEQVAGTQVGKLFEITGDRLSLGRNEDNDIILPNESVSRHHAEIERSPDGRIWIRDNQSKNGVQVNGEAVSERELVTGDVVQLGNFIFRFTNPEANLPEPLPQQAPPQTWDADGVSNIQYKPRGGNRRILIYGVVGLLLAGAVYISQQDDKPKDDKKAGQETPVKVEKPPVATGLENAESGEGQPTEAPSLKTASPGPKVTGLEDPVVSKLEQDLQSYDAVNSSMREAEQDFRKGLREYENQNYNRAIEAFQTALSLDRTHPLAGDYLRLVVYEAESEAKRNMEIANHYLASLQYARALYHFKEVVSLMAHRPSDPMVGQAEARIQDCKKRLQAAELYP